MRRAAPRTLRSTSNGRARDYVNNEDGSSQLAGGGRVLLCFGNESVPRSNPLLTDINPFGRNSGNVCSSTYQYTQQPRWRLEGWLGPRRGFPIERVRGALPLLVRDDSWQKAMG
jgi:hypothetical protein